MVDPTSAPDTEFLREGLIDAAIDAYVEWREASRAVRRAYRRWNGAAGCDRSVAFAAYAVALEREAHAGDLYATTLACVRAIHVEARCDRRPAKRVRRRRLLGLWPIQPDGA